MELFHNVEKTIEKIEDGATFTERVLKNGNAVEILLVKRQITDQMLSLINNTPKPDLNVKIEFETDAEKFEEAVKSTFGNFKKQEVEKKVQDAVTNCKKNVDRFANCGRCFPQLNCNFVTGKNLKRNFLMILFLRLLL